MQIILKDIHQIRFFIAEQKKKYPDTFTYLDNIKTFDFDEQLNGLDFSLNENPSAFFLAVNEVTSVGTKAADLIVVSCRFKKSIQNELVLANDVEIMMKDNFEGPEVQ